MKAPADDRGARPMITQLMRAGRDVQHDEEQPEDEQPGAEVALEAR